MEKMSPVKAIKTFFEAGGRAKVTLKELQSFTAEERVELGKLAAAELGVEIEVK